MTARPRVLLGVAGVASAMAVLLSGCALVRGPVEDPEVSTAQAKKSAQDAEKSIIDLIPRSDVVETHQIETASFLSCSTGFLWSGNIQATLAGGTDAEEVLRSMGAAARREQLDVSDDRTSVGSLRYAFVNRQGVRLLATVWDDGRKIDVDSFSACFRVPDDWVPPSSY
ncbi:MULTISPECIES: hypothetical protein [unclassified Curtobacterium]|uniref:hypothetical protein n=1 Tax=unclassified Curtobacterium TaxID=257496 RepID=UPI00111382DC|nr:MULTISPECIES: hypothetical protein [unclassified Curtobacterium]